MSRSRAPRRKPKNNRASRANMARRWWITSTQLTKAEAIRVLSQVKGVQFFVGATHDRDPGTEDHLQILLVMLDARAGSIVENYFEADVIVKPFGSKSGDVYAVARDGIRYLLHRDPSSILAGKMPYPDGAIFASVGYDWRAELERLAEHEESSREVPALQKIEMQVIAGELKADEVADRYLALYVKNPNRWRALEKDANDRLSRLASKCQAARDAERREQERQAVDRRAREKLDVELAERLESEQQQAERELEQARLRRENEQRREAQRRYEESPEWQEELDRRAEESERVEIIGLLRVVHEVHTEAELVRRVKGFWMADGGHEEFGFSLEEFDEQFQDDRLTRTGALMAMSVRALDGPKYGSEGYLEAVREEVQSFKRDLARVSLWIQAAEFHALDDAPGALDRALSLRKQYRDYPDLVALPQMRVEFLKRFGDQMPGA